MADKPYKQRGGRPPLDVNFVAVYSAVQEAWNGSGETITEIAERFGVSREWIWKWVYPRLGYTKDSIKNSMGPWRSPYL